MQKQPLRVWLYARTADARPGVLEEQLNSLYREAERRGYTVVNGGAEHRCAGDLDRPALFAMLAAVRGGRVDAVMLTRLSRFSYHRLALYLIPVSYTHLLYFNHLGSHFVPGWFLFVEGQAKLRTMPNSRNYETVAMRRSIKI